MAARRAVGCWRGTGTALVQMPVLFTNCEGTAAGRIRPSRCQHFNVGPRQFRRFASKDTEQPHPAIAETLATEAKRALQESQESWNQGDFVQCAEKCRVVTEEMFGPLCHAAVREANWETVCSAHVNGACALKALHRYDEAAASCEEGLKIMSRRFSKHKKQVVQILDLLAELCLLCGHLDDADKHIDRALKVKAAFPWQGASLAATWNLQAQLNVQRGNLEAAKRSFRKSLDGHVSSSGGQQGELPSAAAVVLSNYAGLLRQQGLIGEAVQCYMKALEIFEATVGPESEAVGRTLVELGAMYVEVGVGGPRAVEPLTRGLAVLSGSLGGDHPSVVTTMDWLTKCMARGTADATIDIPEGCPVERLLEQHGKEKPDTPRVASLRQQLAMGGIVGDA